MVTAEGPETRGRLCTPCILPCLLTSPLETPASCEFLDSEQELPQNLQPGVLQGAGLVVPRSQPACLPLSKSW